MFGKKARKVIEALVLIVLLWLLLIFGCSAQSPAAQRGVRVEVISVNVATQTLTVRCPPRYIYSPVYVIFILKGPADLDYAHVALRRQIDMFGNDDSLELRLAFDGPEKGQQKLQWCMGFKVVKITVGEEKQ